MDMQKYVDTIMKAHREFLGELTPDDFTDKEDLLGLISLGCTTHFSLAEHFLALLPKPLRDNVIESTSKEMIDNLDKKVGSFGIVESTLR